MDGALIDTNILIDILRSYRHSRPKNEEYKYNSKSSLAFLDKLFEEETPRYISCHTLKELLQYPHISKEEEDRILNIIPSLFEILPTTQEICYNAGLLARQSADYRDHHIEDCYIAATAITLKLKLYTRNPADFKYVPHKDLQIIVPYQYTGFAT